MTVWTRFTAWSAGGDAVGALLNRPTTVQRCGGNGCDCEMTEDDVSVDTGRVLQRAEDAQEVEEALPEPAEDPGITAEPTPGHRYQIRRGDTLFGITSRAYSVSPGSVRLALARVINDHPANHPFHSEDVSANERKLFGGARISLLPRFSSAPGGSRTFAVIYIPPERDAPTLTPGGIEAIEAPASVTPPARVAVKAKLQDTGAGAPVPVFWTVVVAADMTQLPGVRVISEDASHLAVLEADETASHVRSLELRAATDPSALRSPAAAALSRVAEGAPHDASGF
ncbi:MAG: hypothetical protein GEU74_14190 [Nitriliruptorales bacterium]|nr:hypothetical protein [Nitriliruptorales bacterium]